MQDEIRKLQNELGQMKTNNENLEATNATTQVALKDREAEIDRKEKEIQDQKT